MEWMARKVASLRIFEQDGLMNKSVIDIGANILSVSQFTLLADCSRGNRPGFSGAMPPDEAREMFEQFNQLLAKAI